jgi:hypothetical protein
VACKQRQRQAPEQTFSTLNRRWGRTAFMGILLTVVGLYMLILGYHLATPRRVVVAKYDWLDCCRELCLRFGW